MPLARNRRETLYPPELLVIFFSSSTVGLISSVINPVFPSFVRSRYQYMVKVDMMLSSMLETFTFANSSIYFDHSMSSIRNPPHNLRPLPLMGWRI
ncbi:hypothetical protein L210DRAFT_3470318 [Boletus edulis BED1]|uniref:Uncharacterized protein n=1 Tax=Boletus edulis BED1 TaxID=1328754 RepID=A0AAD4C6X4_BOLED|nr:hypothetical protein L210DRAFT_3470318 [Boletus edulis BED1]